MPTSKYELAELISRRDGISMNEAMNCIEECGKEIEYIINAPDKKKPINNTFFRKV